MLLQINDEREIVPLLPKQSYFPPIPTTEKKSILYDFPKGNWLMVRAKLQALVHWPVLPGPRERDQGRDGVRCAPIDRYDEYSQYL